MTLFNKEMQELVGLRAAVPVMTAEITRLRAELAASQAREAQMREVLENPFVAWIRKRNDAANYASDDSSGFPQWRSEQFLDVADVALALPQDTTALDARIRAERAKERERVKQAVRSGSFLHDQSPAKRFADEVGAMIDRMGDE